MKEWDADGGCVSHSSSGSPMVCYRDTSNASFRVVDECERAAIDFRRLGAAYFDEPEPRLAILGPPAVTRLMVELWRADPQMRSRFDLANPLHRRCFALWLGQEGKSLGLDQCSIAAALALIQRGTSLLCPAPHWPPQASHTRSPSHGGLDYWLAQTIAEPAGIPMPRALALLWELRQDVRLHFANRTRPEICDYIGWCLTQGVRDGCVAVDLIEPALASFLDMPDPELDQEADRLPATRLVPRIAPLYDGPHPDISPQIPHTRQPRFCVAARACGLLSR